MELQDAITLIQPAFKANNSPMHWADLGCGAGLFSEALAHILPQGSTVFAIDRAPQSLIPTTQNVIQFIQADFTKDLPILPFLDGILMANSLHFVEEKHLLLQKLSTLLKSDGQFIIIEYDTDIPNPWVPFPISQFSLLTLLQQCGYDNSIKLGTRKSVYRQGDLVSFLFSKK